ncbi:hypothetical protein B0A48_18651 [Cryoendolithus antarcticus]|uniref:Uncharacterized protein n=1 Tax=Cryoendolithus antarcticus TaxID=1507870 RepID=A0A1V8S7U3_9PEZI|nr:hypothetical protein B0A48_18651 [Cryoendolithus antarcticus]
MSRNSSHTNLATAHAFKQRSPQPEPLNHVHAPQQQQTQYGKPAQQLFYSCNPNGKSKSNGSMPPTYSNMPQHHMQGMNQTLSMSMLDNNSAFTNSPANDTVMSPFSPAGYGFCGYQDSITLDPSKETSIGQLTPGEGKWQGLLNDTWDEQTAV